MKHEPAFTTIAPSTLCRSFAFGLLRAVGRAVHVLLTWDARWRERRHLADLSEEALADHGRTRPEIEAEVAKPFWKA
jgi:uncharacterized protein YjiS (DUF1127 family)